MSIFQKLHDRPFLGFLLLLANNSAMRTKFFAAPDEFGKAHDLTEEQISALKQGGNFDTVLKLLSKEDADLQVVLPPISQNFYVAKLNHMNVVLQPKNLAGPMVVDEDLTT